METLVLFFAVCLLSTATPGPSILYVTSQGISEGLPSALRSGGGVLAADALYILLSITGLTAVLVSSYELFTAIKWAGAVYLVYLGVRYVWTGLFGRPVQAAPEHPERPAHPAHTAFLGGFALHAANPKALLYFGSLVPQFVNPSRPLIPQLGALASIHLATAAAVLLAYSLLAARLGRAMTDTRVHRVFHTAAGSVLIGAGVTLALSRRALR